MPPVPPHWRRRWSASGIAPSSSKTSRHCEPTSSSSRTWTNCAGTARPRSSSTWPRGWTPPLRTNERRQDLAYWLVEDEVGDVVEGRGLRVDDHERRAGVFGERNEAGRRVDLQAGADGEQQVGLLGGAHGALDHLRHQGLPERDGRALENAPASIARRVGLAVAHAIEHGLHGPAPIALHAHHVP